MLLKTRFQFVKFGFHLLNNNKRMNAARIIQNKKRVAQLSQRDRATHAPVDYSNLMTGGV